MIRLDGKNLIVTGATQGLGADIAKRLIEAGACVAIVGRGAQKGKALERALGARARFVEADLSSDRDIEVCVEKVIGLFGAIDGLVNNACIYDDPGLAATREQWHRLLDVNLIGPAILSAKVAERMPEAGGVIVNIGSIGGKTGAANRMLYPASKAAILQITKNLAVTLSPRNIRVLSVSPAVTWSPSVESSTGSIDKADERGAVLHPLGRIGRGYEVANAVLFACSELASFMTGTDIAVDGGYTSVGPDQGLGPRPWMSGLPIVP
ncbi:SDR family oxidoreductase [Bradyrhizobium sp. CCBAU 53338]|uniref:SDR family oxidoreductase n=1 Tax=Bradyrhizobium sp. CCBAU 53338 TaxID=1325111 RepID=UPI00188C5402|nr:SDR family oxidoreductase [Bradyrhizobium sp. CCBAU 53338]QOZ52540.1 short-chain dehydrogenase [Bradyrhizobium sp. CCBAU 53338]